MKSNAINLSAVLVALALGLATDARAAVSIVSVENGSTPPTLDSTYGTHEIALNLGGGSLAGGTLVRDGITFTNVGSGNPGGPSGMTFGSANGITITGTAAGGNGNIGFTDLGEDLFQTEAFGPGGATSMTMNITGLDVSRSYRVQFLHGEPRALTYNAGTITATDSNANVATPSLTFGPGGSSNEYALVTMDVSGSTSLTYTMPKATRGASFSGVSIQSIPEPATLGLLAGGGLLTTLRRRRRNA